MPQTPAWEVFQASAKTAICYESRFLHQEQAAHLVDVPNAARFSVCGSGPRHSKKHQIEHGGWRLPEVVDYKLEKKTSETNTEAGTNSSLGLEHPTDALISCVAQLEKSIMGGHQKMLDSTASDTRRSPWRIQKRWVLANAKLIANFYLPMSIKWAAGEGYDI
ncbi:hypothetical protein HBI68_093470 [Parastagonospora nodorum]|nr:hypothetical protein HBH71_007370 [Parastagonospora nodorum]KAH6168034.1 hypothetical protein HBI68_093470 [Parastagonospora nodorum]